MERMDVKQTALYIGASEDKLRDMVRLKQIPHYRIGSKILFRTATINEWIAAQEQNCKQEAK